MCSPTTNCAGASTSRCVATTTNAALRLANELRLQLHRAEAVDLAVDVVVFVDQSDVAHLGAGLERAAGALDLEVLDHGDRVAIGEHVADRVAMHALRIGCIDARRPLVPAF